MVVIGGEKESRKPSELARQIQESEKRFVQDGQSNQTSFSQKSKIRLFKKAKVELLFSVVTKDIIRFRASLEIAILLKVKNKRNVLMCQRRKEFKVNMTHIDNWFLLLMSCADKAIRSIIAPHSSPVLYPSREEKERVEEI